MGGVVGSDAGVAWAHIGEGIRGALGETEDLHTLPRTQVVVEAGEIEHSKVAHQHRSQRRTCEAEEKIKQVILLPLHGIRQQPGVVVADAVRAALEVDDVLGAALDPKAVAVDGGRRFRFGR